MRIFWQSFVDASVNAPYMALLSEYLNKIAAPGTTVHVEGISPPDRDFGRLAELRCAVQAIDNGIAAEEGGFDAFVMGHFQDPGLYELRSTLDIPVIGTGLVTLDPVFEVWHYEQAERYGLGDRVVHVAGLGCKPEDFASAFAGDQAAH